MSFVVGEKKQGYIYTACIKSRQIVSPLGMERRKSSPSPGMLRESFTGIQAGFEGWGESADREEEGGMCCLAGKSTEHL